MRGLALLSVVAALGAAATAMARAPRYLLVDDRSGRPAPCYEPWLHRSAMVVDMRAGRTVLRGLDRSLAERTVFSPDGAAIAWPQGRSLWLGDLTTGRALLLGRATAGSLPSGVEIGPNGDSALFADRAGVVVVARLGYRVLAVPAPGASLTPQPNLSADGRFASYVSQGQMWVTALTGPAGRPSFALAMTSAAVWSPVGDRIAFIAGDVLHVVDVPTRRTTVFALPAGTPELGYAWSPDGRYITAGEAVFDVTGSAPLSLPDLGGSALSWRPGHPHDLTAQTPGNAFDVIDVATATRRSHVPLVGELQWSPDGRWVVDRVNRAVRLEQPDGRPVAVPDELDRLWRSNSAWLAPDWLALQGKRALRIARPPTWMPRIVARGGPKHVLVAERRFAATPRGLKLLARAFAPRARTSRC